MKLFTTSQIRGLDQYTIDHEPVASLELMERAADALFESLLGMYPFNSTAFCIIAGPGNNGGDALALARKLKEAGYPVHVYLYSSGNLSADCSSNRIRLLRSHPEIITEHLNDYVAPVIRPDAVVIDGLFGSGLTRPLTGIFAQVVDAINQSPNEVVSIDMPSGLLGDSLHKVGQSTVYANYTLSFQVPKLAFFYPENDEFVGRWSILDIDLHPGGIAGTETPFYYQDAEAVRPLLKKRSHFAHKGSCGHLAILAGSKGMAGASILSARAALRTGVGLLTVHGPEGNRCILQTIVPEVIYDADPHLECISEFYHANKYDALAIGPGMGTRTASAEMMRQLLQQSRPPAVFDADALNILSMHDTLLPQVPKGSILTPHPGEFARLFGETRNSMEQLEEARLMAARYEVIIVLKGAHTRIVTPQGKVWFNGSGNPGMATGGTGDVLTGIIGSLLAQTYDPESAARLGVFLHGLAADLALKKQSEESLLASDVIESLGAAFLYLKQ